jgi:hypothetical protein
VKLRAGGFRFAENNLGHIGIVALPGFTNIEYKYIKKNGNRIIWASDPNWKFKTPESGTEAVSDIWR